jgi:hypothetical protein
VLCIFTQKFEKGLRVEYDGIVGHIHSFNEVEGWYKVKRMPDKHGGSIIDSYINESAIKPLGTHRSPEEYIDLYRGLREEVDKLKSFQGSKEELLNKIKSL